MIKNILTHYYCNVIKQKSFVSFIDIFVNNQCDNLIGDVLKICFMKTIWMDIEEQF